MTTIPGKLGVTKVPAPKAGTTKGRNSSPLALFAEKNGKAANKQSLLPGQKTTVTPGDPVDRSMGHYGQDGGPSSSYLADDSAAPSGIGIRNLSGGIRSRPRSGGMGGQFQRTPEVAF